MRYAIPRLLLGSLLLWLSACSNYPDSPEAVARAFMQALSVKDYALASRYVKPDLRDDLLDNVQDELEQLSPVPRQLELSAAIDGETALVTFDNWDNNAELQLILVGKQWVITK